MFSPSSQQTFWLPSFQSLLPSWVPSPPFPLEPSFLLWRQRWSPSSFLCQLLQEPRPFSLLLLLLPSLALALQPCRRQRSCFSLLQNELDNLRASSRSSR